MPRHRPDFDAFARLAEGGSTRCVPVYRQLTADGLTPVSAFLKVARPGASFLFESVVGGEKVGRFSFLGTQPFLTFEAFGDQVTITRTADGSVEQRTSADPFADLQALVDASQAVHVAGLPRFTGGAVGYAAYDAVRYTERLPDAPPDDRGLPDLAFGLYDRMVVFDHIRKTVLVVAQAHVGPGIDLHTAYHDAAQRVDEMVAQLAAPSPELSITDFDPEGAPQLPTRSNFTREAYEDVVRRCQEYIKAGDIFQVVPSQRFEVPTRADALAIYRVLRVVNPSPFLFYLPFGSFSLIGSSPEILVRVEDRTVTIRPIAGTRRRGADEAEDQALAEELLADPKERAEHIMLVDLGRNDVGHVSELSTVRLTELMVVERYSHVMHITSNVQGQLSAGKSAFDALRSGLPAGTVSGAPKVRAMQIIDEMEPQRRGPYAGAVGYIDFTGNMDTCIALRTIVLKDGVAQVQAGGGVVYDSIPSDEYEETVNKSRGMIRAIEIAEARAVASEQE
jgi:anthranilate synthase component 1